METKRLKSVIDNSQSSTAMMSYCIIRSKLKRAKRDEDEHLRDEFNLCEFDDSDLTAAASQVPQRYTRRCDHYEATQRSVSHHNQTILLACSECQDCSTVEDISASLSSSSLAAMASQTRAMTRIEEGLGDLGAISAGKPPSSSFNANKSCQPKNENPTQTTASVTSKLRRVLIRPAEKHVANVGGNRCSSKLALPSHWGLLFSVVLLVLSLSGQKHEQRLESFGQQRKLENSEGILNVVYEPIKSALLALGEPMQRALFRGGAVELAEAQYRPEWPSKSLQQEIFLLNLEDGYFGCQVNESQDFLQLFELSRLCDGQTQCYLGTDELAAPLKCNNRERCGTHQNSRGQQEGIQCVNGVCLDGLCYCNDGFGGKSCDVPDENECKFRPCDVFAHCTNTMGSYYCSCFPGKSQSLLTDWCRLFVSSLAAAIAACLRKI